VEEDNMVENTQTAETSEASPAKPGKVLETRIADFSGKFPGDPGFNVIGAEVRRCDLTYGISHQYHPKHGILPILNFEEDHRGVPTPIPGVQIADADIERRDKMIEASRKAYANGTNAYVSLSKDDNAFMGIKPPEEGEK
jgi:hypothetical protein